MARCERLRGAAEVPALDVFYGRLAMLRSSFSA